MTESLQKLLDEDFDKMIAEAEVRAAHIERVRKWGTPENTAYITSHWLVRMASNGDVSSIDDLLNKQTRRRNYFSAKKKRDILVGKLIYIDRLIDNLVSKSQICVSVANKISEDADVISVFDEIKRTFTERDIARRALFAEIEKIFSMPDRSIYQPLNMRRKIKKKDIGRLDLDVWSSLAVARSSLVSLDQINKMKDHEILRERHIDINHLEAIRTRSILRPGRSHYTQVKDIVASFKRLNIRGIR